MLWIKSDQTRLEEFAAFLQRVLAHKQLLLNKIIQLFLQSHLSVELIQENLDGHRSDDVVEKRPRIEFNLNTETRVIENIMNLKLEKINNTQNTYHGPTESYRSVQNLFNNKRKSVVHNHNYMNAVVEDSNDEDDVKVPLRSKVLY